jgi:hypothetical protein
VSVWDGILSGIEFCPIDVFYRLMISQRYIQLSSVRSTTILPDAFGVSTTDWLINVELVFS